MEERNGQRVLVEGDVGLKVELCLDEIAPPGTEMLTDYERTLIDSMRRLIRARIEAILEVDDVEKEI